MANALSAYLLTTEATTDVLSAYSSGSRTLPALTSERWIRIGSFRTIEAVQARLNVTGSVASGCTLTVALFAPARMADSEAVLSLQQEHSVLSNTISLAGNTLYLVAAKCEAAAEGEAYFGTVSTVSLGAP